MDNSSTEHEVAVLIADYVRDCASDHVNPASLLKFLFASVPPSTPSETVINGVYLYFNQADTFDFDALIDGERND